MEIIDLHGKKIEVTDLSLAILQADDFRHYQLIGSDKMEFNRKQRVYWEDIYIKLLLLEQALGNEKTDYKGDNNDNL
ncbi:hypothetical protein [Mucilaginibacter sp. SJ]|uniref:hypothetical protein n=1 Tax=Mucilaginibacter sp. SJ TaxID=3029053 RepID=UPI0023A9C6F9|nr:hypothetical protein [Mucilaginibacter sp. SJ]WEA00703.1 hypothetical protein MusilaSJ_24935 [Mucilaginibacter sp. SJ]